MDQKELADFQTSGVECPVCDREFKNNKAFGPHFRAAHPGKHVATERVRDAYGGDPRDGLIHWHYELGLTTREIESRFNIPRDGLREAFRRFEVETRGGEVHYASFRTNTNGYESWRSWDPDETQRAMKVHRLLAVSEFGIEAVKDKHVHHKDRIPWDNRPENIELRDEKDHLREHYAEREIDELGRFK